MRPAMKIAIYQIDTFTNKLFSGNPAAVCVLEEWLIESLMQSIAAENNLPATAFLLHKKNTFSMRWFGPEYEIPLCGHGTLACASVIFEQLHVAESSISVSYPKGSIKLHNKNNLLSFEFPIRPITEFPLDPLLIKGLGIISKHAYMDSSERLLVIAETEEEIARINPDMQILSQWNFSGIVVTAPGNSVDFVSRTFYPKKSISEDAVTGSSHCSLVPYWANRLKKRRFIAHQLSKRGGTIHCELHDNNISIEGAASLYMKGLLFL
jgi:PhzF family phenazine biosynthesis protein